MSYLLTEIALEMLGYKFYDVEGTPRQTNFQDYNPGKVTGNEECLTNMLEICVKENTAMGSARKSITREKFLQFPTTLSKLLDMEYERIRDQIEQSKIFDDEVAGYIEHQQMLLTEFLQPYVVKERAKLHEEIQNMQEFRSNVEQHILLQDPNTYKEYNQVFSWLQPGRVNEKLNDDDIEET